MMMKYILFTLLLLFLTAEKASSQELVITQTDGTETAESLKEITNITFAGGDILINLASDVTNAYSIESIRKMHFDEVTFLGEAISDAAMVFPNPAKDKLKLTGIKSSSNEVVIYRPDGSIAQIYVIGDINDEIDVTGLRQGIYFLQIDETIVKFIKL